MRPIKVWDLPVRLFHWAIVALIFFSWGTQELNYMDWHAGVGCTILTLLLFRVMWGFVGSDTARFTRFPSEPIGGLAPPGSFAAAGARPRSRAQRRRRLDGAGNAGINRYAGGDRAVRQ